VEIPCNSRSFLILNLNQFAVYTSESLLCGFALLDRSRQNHERCRSEDQKQLQL
jgi:hypothetical protein